MKRRIITILTVLLGFFIAQAQSFLNMESRNLSAKDGLSCNQVYDIIQDRQGYIWFATSNGLSRYDGYSFLNYNMLGGANMKPIQASLGHVKYDDANGFLWATTTGNQVACYSLAKARFVDYTAKGDYMRRYAHLLYDGKQVWLYDAKEGIRNIQYGDGQFVCTDYTQQTCHFLEGMKHVMLDQAHQAWVTTKNGLYLLQSRHFQQKAKGNVVCGQRIGSKMAFLTDRGLLYLFDATGKLLKQANLSSHRALKAKITASVGWNNQWIVFTKTETLTIDLKTMDVSKPTDLQLNDARLLESQHGTDFVSARNGDMVIFSPQGIYRRINLLEGVKDQGNRHRKYNIFAVSDMRFLIATYGNGAFVYDVKYGVLEHVAAGDGKNLLASNFLTGALQDKRGNIWLCQDEGGVACLSKSFNSFMQYAYPAPHIQLGGNDNAVLRILSDAQGKPELICKNKTRYTFYPDNLTIGSRQDIPNGIYSAFKDSRGHYWEGTRGGGLFVDGMLCKEKGKGDDLTINDVYDIVEDKMGRIWVATIRASSEGGLLLTQYQGKGVLTLKRFLTKETELRNVHKLSMDNDGMMWIVTSGGLCVVDVKEKNITDKSFRVFNMSNGKLPFSELLTVKCTSNGDVWVGGVGTGLLRCRYDDKTGELTYDQYTTENGLGSNNVSSILEDPAGNIWAGTESGLARVDVRTGRIDNNVLNEDVQSNSYQESCVYKLADGRLLFGTNNGLVVVDSYKASFARIATASIPTITDVLVNGLSIYKMDEVDGSPSTVKKLKFRYDQNSISFSFSNFDYAGENSSVYQYYLEGVDKGWNHATNKNSVSYNGLQPGDYVFHVRSMGHGNQWSKERTLKIHISEPWYNMWYSWMVYLLVVGVVAYYVFRNRKEKFQLHQRMKMEKQVNDFRINFFTHVTHEFRTPLAIIQSAVSKIIDEKTGSVSKASLQTAVRGTKRLSRLVTQLMEFRKINSDGLRLQVIAGVDIIGFVRNIYQDFWYAAKQKEITLNFTGFEKKYEMTCDRHIVEMVVYNLLSNAIKYTPNKGVVNVKLEGDEEQNVLRVTVSDSGVGISEEQQKNLFQPFMHGYVSQGGMGIGLYVARMMIQLHHGNLEYHKSEELGGASFVFTIPLSDDCYTSEEYLDMMAVADNHTTEKEERQLEDIREMLPKALNEVTVAVIEDDPDMQEQIRTELAQYFKVQTYSNGKQGLEGVLAEKPALLICDVMLPDMNGYDIVKQIKEQPDGYTLPVIMLTALNDEKHQIKGYKAGADDYMVKPCNFRLLVARIIQLITWAAKLPKPSDVNQEKEQGGTDLESTEAAKPVVMENVVDKNLLDRFQNIVAQHIAEPDFTIDALAGMMHMGRTKLYGKIKELTGETPNKYFMKRRMEMAAELLLTGEYNVSDVCYKVGLEDVSYFNKCFKSYYGVSPSKYGK